MQKLLRILVLLILLFLVGGVVYTQTQFFSLRLAEPASEAGSTRAQQAVADIAAKKPEPAHAAQPVATAPAATVAPPPPAPVLGTESSPVSVKIISQPESEEAAAERLKTQEVLVSIAHSLTRLSSDTHAQNFILLFQAIVYSLMLLILLILLQNVKKSADAAARSADAAKKSAEAAELLLKKPEKSIMRKFPPRFYRKR